MREDIIYKAKSPISFYVGLKVIVAFAIITIVQIEFPDSLIYPSIVGLLWFVSISKFACRVIVSNNKLIIKYLAYWHSNKEIDLSQIKSIKVKTSYWSFNMRHDTNMFREYIFYDEIILTDLKDNEHRLQINSRIGSLNKLIDKINSVIRKHQLTTANKM